MSTIHPTSDLWLRPDPSSPLRMTEEEFCRWAFTQHRVEWVDGEVVFMSPVNADHSDLTNWLFRLLADYADFHDLGKVVCGDFLIKSSSKPKLRVPDIFFLAKQRVDLMRYTRVDGPPDLIVETISPDSVARYSQEKYAEYQEAGVKEYWVINPDERKWDAFALGANGKYVRILERDGKIASATIASLQLPVAWMWPETRPLPRVARKILGID